MSTHHHVNVTHLRQHLPEYLAKVSRGDRVSITSRGKVVAELSTPTLRSDQVNAVRARLQGTLVRWEDAPAESMLDDAWEMDHTDQTDQASPRP